MKLFELLFGKNEYGKPTTSPPPDSPETLATLARLKTYVDVVELQRSVRIELAGGEEAFAKRQKEVEQLRTDGNKLFEEKDYEAAMDVYKKAIFTTDDNNQPPTQDVRFYTNIALCLINLERYEEAVVYSKMATQLDNTWIRALELAAIAYAHLGYDSVAAAHVAMLRERQSQPNLRYIRDILTNLQSIRSQRQRPEQQVNSDDLLRTLKRLVSVGNFDDDDKKKEETIVFLLYHLNLHGDQCPNGCRPLYDGGFMRLFKQVPLIKRLFSPEINLASLTLIETCVVELMLNLIGFVVPMETAEADLADRAMRDLATMPGFIDFACSLGGQLVSRDGVRLVATSPFHGLVLDKFIPVLLPFDDSPKMRNRFVKGKMPLCDPTFAVYLWAATFCRSLDINKLRFAFDHGLARLGNLADEEPVWFLDPWRKAQPAELANAVAIASNLGSLLFLLVQSPNSFLYISPMLFWRVATESRQIADACVQRPSFAYFLTRRFNWTVDVFRNGSYDEPIRSELLRIVMTFQQILPPDENGKLLKFWEKTPCFNEELIRNLVSLSEDMKQRRLPGLDKKFAKNLQQVVELALLMFKNCSDVFAAAIQPLEGRV